MTSDRKVIMLGLALVATAAFGARSLLTASGGATESGFDGVDPFPLTTTADADEPVELRLSATPRNPFVQLDGGDDTPSTETTAAEVEPDTDDPGPDASGTGDTAPTTTPSTATEPTPVGPTPDQPVADDVVPTEPLDPDDLRRSDDAGGDDTDSNGRGR